MAGNWTLGSRKGTLMAGIWTLDSSRDLLW